MHVIVYNNPSNSVNLIVTDSTITDSAARTTIRDCIDYYESPGPGMSLHYQFANCDTNYYNSVITWHIHSTSLPDKEKTSVIEFQRSICFL